ncbi:TlpA family protein disulfide reductase [Pedobacter faecalis]|uniref:TlpA family protein disulfide reductase n=1 Tax=Pedobacter faecalis TaxID=3041495 RepID=UPI00254F50DC|nr:TlpA disulfide reductase family protein [Pedobacter sp. ELA7]
MKFIKFDVLCLITFLFLFSCRQAEATVIDTPAIVSGTAKLSGRIITPEGAIKDGTKVKITVPHQVSGEFVKYEAAVDRSGNFSIDAEVETSVSYIHFSTSLDPSAPLLLKLRSDTLTHLEITYTENLDVLSVGVSPEMNLQDVKRGFEVIRDMIEYPPRGIPEPLYDKSIDYFLTTSKSELSERSEVVKNDKLISKELKQVLYDDLRLLFYRGAVFNYGAAMKANYRRSGGDTSKAVVIQKIDRSYYRFLKDLELNSPGYLYAFSFWEFQRELLENEILYIPPIGDSDVESWLSTVKGVLSDLVGFEGGLYYDLLAANAYGKQLTEGLKPFNKKQEKNIRNYWGDGEIAKILFRKNQKVVQLAKFKSPVVVNDVSKMTPEEVINNIVAQHADKVILIDLWATWCGPCLEAMQRFRPTKAEFYDKDVVFVYLTNPSSPVKLWKEKIAGIGSEHYYLSNAQWQYIMNRYKFDAIPSYLLFNREGKLVRKFTAFPENEVVKDMLISLL